MSLMIIWFQVFLLEKFLSGVPPQCGVSSGFTIVALGILMIRSRIPFGMWKEIRWKSQVPFRPNNSFTRRRSSSPRLNGSWISCLNGPRPIQLSSQKRTMSPVIGVQMMLALKRFTPPFRVALLAEPVFSLGPIFFASWTPTYKHTSEHFAPISFLVLYELSSSISPVPLYWHV